ncbi:unnamed protein product, partial [Amoebophrya sp. A25]
AKVERLDSNSTGKRKKSAIMSSAAPQVGFLRCRNTFLDFEMADDAGSSDNEAETDPLSGNSGSSGSRSKHKRAKSMPVAGTCKYRRLGDDEISGVDEVSMMPSPYPETMQVVWAAGGISSIVPEQGSTAHAASAGVSEHEPLAGPGAKSALSSSGCGDNDNIV